MHSFFKNMQKEALKIKLKFLNNIIIEILVLILQMGRHAKFECIKSKFPFISVILKYF